MAFLHTPESLIPRLDSKNPATTCKGITLSGRPCRRALAQSSTRTFQNLSMSCGNGVSSVLEERSSNGSSTAAFYCWQHKDQVENLAVVGQQQMKVVLLKERTSVDTLVDRIGVMNLDEDVPKEKKTKNHLKTNRRDEHPLKKRDSGWRDVQSPLTAVPEDVLPSLLKPVSFHHGRSNVKASFLCCLRAEDDDLPAPRKRHERQRPGPNHSSNVRSYPIRLDDEHPERSNQSRAPITKTSRTSPHIEKKPGSRSVVVLRPDQPPTLESSHQPIPPRQSPHTSLPLASNTLQQTQSLLSLIPSYLSPTTTSLLLSELSKPISPTNNAAYIYIFWLTPDSELSKPDDETAFSLLEPLTSTSPNARDRARRESDALKRYASQHRSTTQPRTILLKIGRAANVHRRLSQWTKQCGKNITLIRYYPYTPMQIQSAPIATPRKVPYASRVERLIHVELLEKRITDQGPCESCGREHREWFEIPATREGLRSVDEVVRRWVGWGERHDDLT
jgi:Meiotically up-regulated gene 113